jgi:4-amino-4-deoxy-L-arabinose transferase-like glycosyltransferase
MDPNVLEWPDPNHYLAIANTLADGGSYSSETHNLYRSPGYPYFLSFIIRVVGDNLLLIRFVHIAFYAIFLIGAFCLGKEWKNDQFGLLLTLICCLYPYYIYIPLTLYPEALLIFISSWIIYFLLKLDHSFKTFDLLLISLLISVGVLVRPTFIVVSIAFVCYFALTKNTFLNKLKVSILLIIVPVFFLSMWGFRNFKVHDQFIVSTAASTNLFYGYNENTTVKTKSDCPIPEDIQNKLNAAADVFEKDSIYKSSAIEFIKNNPAKSIFLATIRMLDLWNPIPHTSTNYSVIKKVLSSIPYTIILLLSLFGFYALRKNYFAYMLLGILILNTGANGLFGVSIRYRVIFDIILLLTFIDFIYPRIFKNTKLDIVSQVS